jgi:general secretion pathway protein K
LKTHPAHSKPARGFALMLVMIVIFVLTVIVAAFTYSMKVEMRLAQVTDYDVQLEWMGRSGVELARYALSMKCAGQEGLDSLNQFWAGGSAPCSNDLPSIPLKDFPLGEGKISVTITDMERKWDVNNLASPQSPLPEALRSAVLQKAVMKAGVSDPSQASTIVDSILDWVGSNPDPHFNGAKSEFYSHLDPPYYCKNGPVDDLSELLLIKGVTPDIYWGVNSSNHPVSAYQQAGPGGFDHTPRRTRSRFSNEQNQDTNVVGLVELLSPLGGKLNINTASADALQLLPGIDETTAARIIQMRAGPDGIDGTDDDAPFHNVGEINSGLPGGGLPPGAGPGAGPPPAGVPGAPAAGIQAAGLAAYCDVRSYVFEVRVDAEINGVHRAFTGIVSRDQRNPSQVTCVRFHWD